MSKLQKTINKFKSLVQNKNKDICEIEREAQIYVWKKDIHVESRFSNAEDRKMATERLDSYLEGHEIATFNDIQNLADLVYEEVVKHRLQKDIGDMLTDDSNGYTPDKQIDSLHGIQDRIWLLKEKIGIIKKDDKSDLDTLKDYEKQMHSYIQMHKNEFTLYAPYKCSKCGKKDVEPLLLRKRVKDFDVLLHPALSGRFLYNTEIIDDVKKGLITKEQAGRYLRTSESYIDWVLKNEHKKIIISGLSQDEVDDMVNNNPNLRNSEYYSDNKEK